MNAITEMPLRGARVLIAEDDPIIAYDLARLLQDAGAETLGPARRLRDALMLAEASPLHCGILDVSLWHDLIFPVAERLGDRGIGIVFYTGFGNHENLGRDWPGAQSLMKPASPQTLIQTVAAACWPIGSSGAAPA
jgi:DNA-binding response OmpR family regulator